jgi:hypothetical protein
MNSGNRYANAPNLSFRFRPTAVVCERCRMAATAPVLTVSGFEASDENAANAKGILTITDGTLKARIAMFGYYTAAGCTLSPAAGGRTAITTSFSPPAHSHPDLAVSHH